jgi:DisA bacterial checkpoint controller nucleotide-binding
MMSSSLEFYLMCARAQAVSLENRTPIYSNRLDQVPPRVHAAYYAEPNELRNWRQFLEYKFKYLNLRFEESSTAQHSFRSLTNEGAEDEWAPILKLWDEQAAGEKLAYMHRISQMKADLVHAEWYNDLPDFLEWARTAGEELDERRLQAEDPATLYRELIPGPRPAALSSAHALEIAEFELLDGLAGLSERVSASLLAERMDFPPDWLGMLVEAGPPTSTLAFPDAAGRVFSELALFLLRELVKGPVSEERFLRQLLDQLKQEASCDLADFLEVTEGGEKIALVATSLGHLSEEIFRELGEEEVYRRGEGITGSILLAAEPSRLFNVGSNDIAHDPRQSPWHVSAYQNIYGALNDFWTFPVTIDGQLRGAFRVVNRSGAGSLSVRWPTALRRDLAMVGVTVGPLWRFAKDVAADRVFWSVSFEERGEAHRLIGAAECNWISEPVLIESLKLLRAVVQRRVEDHPYGCHLLFVREDALEGVEQLLPSYATAQSPENVTVSQLERLSLRVDSDSGLFLISASGVVMGVRRLEVGRARGAAAIRDLTTAYPCIGLWAHAERRSIHLHAKGRWMAEYYLAERVGRWRLRIFDESLKRALAVSDPAIQPMVIETALQAAWALAQDRNGALFIIADRRVLESKFQFGDGTQDDGQPLVVVSRQDLLARARHDGAVVFSPQGRFECSSAILSPKVSLRLPPEMRRLLGTDVRGGRHTAGCNISVLCPEATVVIVSANGGISILAGGSVVEWDV